MVADLTGDGIILCQITSQVKAQYRAVSLADSDFAAGSLRRDSGVRPDRLFTADGRIVLYQVGRIGDAKGREMTVAIVRILSA